MKTHPNTLRQRIALTVCLALGGTGFAAAQTPDGVTLYGLINMSFTSAKGDNAKRTGLDNTYGPGSRWGLRINEDLGSGLKVGAVLESGFNAVRGTMGQGQRLFGRQSYLWLRSDQYGELRMGRQYMMHDEALGAVNSTGNTLVITPAAIYNTPTGTFSPMLDAPRVDNAVELISPRIGGFQAKFIYAFGNGTQDIYRGIKLDYTGGPWNVVLAHERGSAMNTPVNGDPSVNKVTLFGGSYDFSVVKLFAGYERVKNMTRGIGTQMGTLNMPGLTGDATELKAYTIGVSVPVGDMTYAANYVHSEFGDAGGRDVSVSRYGVAATYNLSKRTAAYSAIALTGGDLKRYVYEKRIFQVGLRHRF